MDAPVIQERDERTLMKVSRAIQRTISIIAKVDGRMVQDVTDEALIEYIQRRGMVISLDTDRSVAQTASQS